MHNPTQTQSWSATFLIFWDQTHQKPRIWIVPVWASASVLQKTANISDILNIPSNLSTSVHPPQGIRNKGCGTKKQRIGPGGQNIKDKRKKAGKRQKAARLCNKCNKYVFDHDSRNCEKIKAAKLAAQAAKRAAAIAAGLPASSSSDSDSDGTRVDLDDTDDDTNDDIDEYNSSD